PITIHGLAVADSETRKFYKLPEYMLERMPQYDFLGRRTAGGRVRFMTDSKEFMLRMTLAAAKEDVNIPLSGSAGADVYLGKGDTSRYLGYIAPAEHVLEEITVEKKFVKSGEMELITINLPRNDHLLAMEIGICEGTRLEKAPDYTIKNPIVFYGSSITEGGCACRAGNAYTSIVCRWLDADYRNFGFSGSARGEKEFAEYIASLTDISVLVYDYDHNSPSPEHLQETHEPFFKLIREKQPNLPVVMMSKPDTDKNIEDSKRRVEIIRKTYQNAVDAGDNNVWFINGMEFFGEHGRAECTVDGTHPNALGFMRMAEKVYPVLKEILEEFI
ncbi:MAG: hypothetical protein J6J86_04720, partial [Lachnospiraceae bacterium]|nr:hypothetical protein [Lachnospiraceae bacterium]